MSAVKMSDEAYVEFKEFLKDNKITELNIRIKLAGIG